MKRLNLPHGFNPRTRVPCEDCMLRDDLDIVGRPRPARRRSISRCQGCGGAGYTVPTKQADPYWTNVKRAWWK